MDIVYLQWEPMLKIAESLLPTDLRQTKTCQIHFCRISAPNLAESLHRSPDLLGSCLFQSRFTVFWFLIFTLFRNWLRVLD